MNEQITTKGAFVLWWRKSRKQQWQRIDSAQTEAELLDRLQGLPSGESISLPAGVHPNDKRRAGRKS